ncbi:MAG: glycosyltransferase family 1 protein [Candidatus Eremiobacterota bacterium]
MNRIGIDARLAAYTGGGIAQYTLNLVRALARLDRDNRYTIFHSHSDADCHTPPEAGNFRRRNLRSKPHHPWERWTLAAELLPHRLDLVHSPDFIPPAAGARHRVVTVHDIYFWQRPDTLTPDSLRYYRDQIAWSVQSADHILVVSRRTRDDLTEHLGVPSDRMTVTHLAANPLYAEEPDPEAVRATLERHRLAPGFILFVGTWAPNKNLATLVRACRRLPDVPLVLVGRKGWYYEDVLAALQSHPDVRHLERVGNRELANLYRAAGVLAMPSLYEGFGLPVLEAMASGCPVVCSRAGSLPEVAEEAAILVEPCDDQAWSTSLARVLTDPEVHRELRARGLARASRFSWTLTAERTLAVYQRVLQG